MPFLSEDEDLAVGTNG